MTVRFHDEGEPWFEDVAARVRGLYATELYAQRAIAEAFRLPPSYVAKLMRHCGLLATRSLGHRPHKFDVRHAQPSRR